MSNQDAENTHRIRLSSAWEPPAERDGAWVRRFGRPAPLRPGERVLLVVERPAIASLTLNATPLPVPAAGATLWSHDITPLLEARNELLLVPDPAHVGPAAGAIEAHGRAALPSRYGIVVLRILTLPAAGR
jgi:hypothetical protein